MANSAWAFFLFSFQVHEKSVLLPLLPVTMLALQAPELAAWLPPLACFSMWPLLIKDGLGVAYFGVVAVFLAVVGGGPPSASTPADPVALSTTQGEEESGSGRGRGRGGGGGGGGGGVGGKGVSRGGGRSRGGGTFIKSDDADDGEVGKFPPPPPPPPSSRAPGGLRRRLSPSAGDAVWHIVWWATAVAAAGAHCAEIFVPPPTRFPYIHSLTFTSLSFLGFGAAAAYCNWRQWRVPAQGEDEEKDDGGEEEEEDKKKQRRVGTRRSARTTMIRMRTKNVEQHRADSVKPHEE